MTLLMLTALVIERSLNPFSLIPDCWNEVEAPRSSIRWRWMHRWYSWVFWSFECHPKHLPGLRCFFWTKHQSSSKSVPKLLFSAKHLSAEPLREHQSTTASTLREHEYSSTHVPKHELTTSSLPACRSTRFLPVLRLELKEIFVP